MFRKPHLLYRDLKLRETYVLKANRTVGWDAILSGDVRNSTAGWTREEGKCQP